MYQLATEPLGIGKLIDGGIKLYLTGFTRVIFFSLIWSVIIIGPSFLMDPIQMADPEAGPSYAMQFYALYLIALGLSAFFYAAIFDRYNRIAMNMPNSFKESLSSGFVHGIAFLVCGILYFIAFVGGSILLIIPGIFLSVMLILGGPAVVIDKLGPVKALKTSYRLVKGNWWRTTILLTIIMIIQTIVIFGLGLVIALVFGASAATGTMNLEDPEAFNQFNMAVNAFNIVIYTLMYPMWAAVLTVIYHDLKLRKEGGDLEARMEN